MAKKTGWYPVDNNKKPSPLQGGGIGFAYLETQRSCGYRAIMSGSPRRPPLWTLLLPETRRYWSVWMK